MKQYSDKQGYKAGRNNKTFVNIVEINKYRVSSQYAMDQPRISVEVKEGAFHSNEVFRFKTFEKVFTVL